MTGSDPVEEGIESPSDDAPRSIRQRIARSSVWPLLLGGRAQPLRDVAEFRALEVSPLPDGEGLQVSGELDVLSLLKLEEAIAQSDLPLPLVLDVSGVTFMDGVGAALLLRLARMRGAEKTVVLVNPSRSVRRILAIAIPDGERGLEIRIE